MSHSLGGGGLPAAAQKSGGGGSHRGSGKSKPFELDFTSLRTTSDDLDVEFGIDDDDADEASTVKKPPSRLAAASTAPPPTSAAAATPLHTPAADSSAAASPAPASAARADVLLGGVAPSRFSAECATGAPATAQGGLQAPSADAQLDETPADRLPQTELLSTQVLDEAMPPLQASLQASTATLTLSQPADELQAQEAPDALMHEADDAHELPLLSAVQSAGNGAGGLSALDAMQGPCGVGDEAALREATMAEAAEPTPVERVVPSPSLRQSPVERELASSVETLDAALAAAPDQAAGGVPSASPFPRSLASSAAGETLRRPFDLASAVAAAQLVQQPEQFAVFADEPQPKQPPPPPSAQRSARADGRVEPPAEGRAEPAQQSAAPPRLTLDQMSAELKKMQTKAREQQVRTQVLMNNIVMLASPLHQLRLAELQKKVEEEHQALAALGQQDMLQ